MIYAIIGGILGVIALAITVWIITLRRVVPTNEVHIIQTSKKTVSYGKDQESDDHTSGNVYFHWPAWLPKLGISVIKLPVSVFSLRLSDYEAYDTGRLPFVLDLEAFFRIENSNIAAQRVENFQDLHRQLTSILQGAARTILASKTIEEIMQGRAEFGEAFTVEVKEQLRSWGVTTVKNIELMDIRDSHGSKVILNIMEKKKSEIERESRVVVAENRKAAEQKEIEARREVELSNQQALRDVGVKTAEKDQAIGVANEKSQQTIKEQQKVTAEKQMEVQRVEEVKGAEISKDVQIVRAEEQRQTDVVKAEGEKQKTVLIAQGALEAQKLAAEGILATGTANAEAEKLIQLAPVEAQIVLAKEIGENQSYQQYLITIRQVEASQAIGIEQAKALEKSDIKVIANGGSASEGLASIGQLISSGGGQQLGAALEGLAQTPIGKAVLDKLT